MSDFGSGLEQYGPQHQRSGRATKADLRRRIAALEAAIVVEKNLVTSAHRAENAKQQALDAERHRAESAESERNHLATMLEIAAEDEWHDSDTIDTLDDYSETWLICLGVRADKRETRV